MSFGGREVSLMLDTVTHLLGNNNGHEELKKEDVVRKETASKSRILDI
jgi:hypothetical protein